METNPFYLVWAPDTGYARVQHRSHEEALDEAERLARLDQGREFYVLKAIVGMRVEIPVQVQELEDEGDIPF